MITMKYLPLYLCFCFFAGCHFGYGPPLIKEIRVSNKAVARDSIWFKCVMAEPGAGGLSFYWFCSKGRFADNERDSVKWYAPESSGSVFVKVKVKDARGDSAVDSLGVEIKPRTVNFINWEGAVKAGRCLFFSDSAWSGYRLSGESSADTGNIFLIFLDSDNFERWLRGEEHRFRIKQPAYRTAPFYDTIPETGVYYLVLDNSHNFTDCSFRVNIRLTSP
ncbi:MAG: hypothetical protein ABIK47_03575 [candidate division WOR-3 bacterium]